MSARKDHILRLYDNAHTLKADAQPVPVQLYLLEVLHCLPKALVGIALIGLT